MTTEAPPFREGPSADSLGPPPAKRGPGRPKGSKTRRRSAPRATGSAPRRPGVSRRKRIGGTLTMLNMALGMTPLRNDQMDALEIDALAKALDEEARKSATFAKYLDAALGMTGAGGIWGVLGLMAMRRAARHGILPSMFDGQAAMLLQMAAQSNEAPVIRATATETTPIVDASTE